MITRIFSFIALCALVACLSACSGSQPSPDFLGSENVSSNPNPSTSDDSELTISDVIDALVIPAADSEGLSTPSSSDQDDLANVIIDLLNGETSGHDQTLAALGYELISADFDDGSDTVLVLRESDTQSLSGGGTFIINTNSTSKLILEVPHPTFDANTMDEGAFLLQELEARALFIAGTHRCANAEESSCSGTTDACGAEGAHRVSDVAHAIDNYFHAAHIATSDDTANSIFISLHGYAQGNDEPTVIVSNGTKVNVGAFAFINQLAAAFDSLFSGSDYANSCNLNGNPDFDLCGTTNVQGRYTNGSDNECTAAPIGYNGRFIHMEQSASLRDDITGWQIVADALAAVF